MNDTLKVLETRRSCRNFDPAKPISDEAVQAIVKAGYAEAMCYERKVLSLSKLEALLGKKKFAEVCGPYITKPQGKPALVPEDDPREPFRTSAAEDFADSEDWLK